MKTTVPDHYHRAARRPIVGLFILALALMLGSSATTALAFTCASTATGNWSNPGTWTGCNSTVPQNGDDVVIASGDTVTMDVNTNSLASITVNGTLSFDNSGVGKSMTATGDVTINSSGTMDVATGGSATTHLLTIGGNLTNDGTFDARPDSSHVIDVTFNKDGNQIISGSGTTAFNKITFDMGTTNANVLDVQALITMASDGLILTNGTFKLSSASTITPFSGSTTIGPTAGFYLNHASAVSNWGSTGSLTVQGALTIANGTMTVGSSSGNRLEVRDATGAVTVSNGTLKVAGRVKAISSGLLTISGGNIVVSTVGHSSSSEASFNMNDSGELSMSGGTVTVQQANENTGGDINIVSGSGAKSITGGTFQPGNASTPTSQTMPINSEIPVHNLTVNSSNATAVLSADLTVNGNLEISSGTFDLNNLNLTVAGTLTNNGTLQQTQTVNNSTVSFLNITNGSGTNKYFGVDITTSNNLDSTTVAVSGNQRCSQANGNTVKRCYEITPTTAASANVKFYFQNAELQTGQTLDSLNAWHYNGSTWDQQTKGNTGTASGGAGATCGAGAIDCYVEATNISSYSPFALQNSDPLAVTVGFLIATAEEDHILVAWQTASELNNRGFNLHRATAVAGRRIQLNTTLIPSRAPGSSQGFSYTYRDYGVRPDVTYWYWLEDVDLSGACTLHGPVSAVLPSHHIRLPLIRLAARR